MDGKRTVGQTEDAGAVDATEDMKVMQELTAELARAVAETHIGVILITADGSNVESRYGRMTYEMALGVLEGVLEVVAETVEVAEDEQRLSEFESDVRH